MVTTTAAVTSTMQLLDYHVMYNTTTDQTPLKQTNVVVGVRVNQKKGYHCSNKYITNPDMDCIKLEVATCKFGDQMTDG
jgi:hypothetical protein